jgi:hypothetical protein
MATIIEVNQRSTIAFTSSFFDRNGDPVTPTAITWTLVDQDGTVINNRLDVDISPPAQEVTVAIGGDDTDLVASTDNGNRRFTIEALYNSVDLGNDLPINDEQGFRVVDLQGVPNPAP